MAKLRKPLPFPFTSAREKRAHQIRDELRPGKTGHFDDRSGQSRFRSPGGFEQHSEAEADGDSSSNEAFFGNGGKGQITEPDSMEEAERTGKKTPAMRLKKKAKSLDLGVLDGLIKPPARARMRIRALNVNTNTNTKRQTSHSIDDVVPAQTHIAIDSRLAMLITAMCLAFLFILYPYATLDLTLVVLMFFGPFPEWMPWWTALLALVLPMGVRARLEVTLFLCGAVWLGGLEWGVAWERVGRWVWDG